MNDTVKINIAKVLEVALEEMRGEDKKSTERLYAIFEAHLKKAIEVTAAGVNLHLDHVHEVTPELIMNLMFHHSLEKALDASECAELFTVGVDGAGLAVVADSFGAISTRIEAERVLTWDALYAAIDNNFENERIRSMLLSAPKW